MPQRLPRRRALSVRVAVVGGGPGGLFFATLIRRADPSVDVTVFERNRADDTFGFGVVFSDRTLAGIHEADPVLREALATHGRHWDDIEVRLKGERIRCGGNGMAAIARQTLLTLMQARARELGADLRFSTEVDLDDLDGFDLVVAAEGAGSQIRERLADGLATSVETATAKFIWFGTDYMFDGLTFVHERGPDGVFAVHGYPISDHVSTFIVETDEESWRRAGLDEFDVTQPPGPSDEITKEYLEKLFAVQIDGRRLLTNNSRWGNFRTRRTTRWHTLDPRPVALLGDAVHTAHFSVGSGTKMAMEDAVALATALTSHDDLPAALAAYEEAAQPSVRSIQDSARPSLSWWEHFGRSHDAFEPWQFAYHFLSRSITDARLARRAPDFVRSSHEQWVQRHGAEPLSTPLEVDGLRLPGRVVDTEKLPSRTRWVTAPADEVGLPAALQQLADLALTGPPLVAVRGGTAHTRTLLTEQARLEHGIPALLVDDDLDRAVTAVLSGRTDLVAAPSGALVQDTPARRAPQLHSAAQEGLGALFDPRGIAVVGASRHPGKLGAVMARSLTVFTGRLALVNARDHGDGFHASVRDAAQDGPVDLAVLCVPAPATAAALAEAADAGARAAVICGGGFAEAGPEGEAHQRDVAAVIARTGVRVLGPNTSGFLAPAHRLTASFVPGVAEVPAGRVAVVAASGGINHALAFLLAEAGHGVSIAVGLGNAVDVTAPDVLEHLAGDPATGAVALHIESVHDGRRLVDAVSRLVRTRPVVALVVGRHDVAAFAASHTGALATSWRAARAALAQAGAVVVDDERELVDAVGALSLVRLPPASDPGVGVVTAQAGPGLLLLDDLRGRGAAVPELADDTRRELADLLPPMTYQANPVDTGRPGLGFDRVLGVVARDPGVDLVAGYALHEPDATDLVASVTAFLDAAPGTPLVLGVGGIGADVRSARRDLLALGVPVAADPTGVAAMVGAVLADARAQHRAEWRPGARHAGVLRTTAPLEPAGGPGQGPWDEDQAKVLVGRLGVATMPRRACANRADAHQALTDLGGPVAVKVLDATVLHKTETGGVRLGVGTAEQLDQALDGLEGAGAQRFLVERMAGDGVDLIAGARRDAVFGPLVVLGLGGTTAEVLADVALRLAPVSAIEAAAMPDDLAGRAVLDGWRSGPVLDRSALAEVMMALGALLVAHPHIAEIEINPLRLNADGLVALDAVCIATEEAVRGDTDQ